MNEMQLNIPFNRLCRNYDKKIDSMSEKKADFLKAFRNVDIRDFEFAVNTLISDTERFDRFPTIAQVYKYIKKEQKVASEKDYSECKACENSPHGLLSIILGYKFVNGKDTVVERHFWSLEKKIELRKRDNGIRYYDYSFACRCPKGIDFYNARGESPPLITPEEFEELKARNKTNDRHKKIIREKVQDIHG